MFYFEALKIKIKFWTAKAKDGYYYVFQNKSSKSYQIVGTGTEVAESNFIDQWFVGEEQRQDGGRSCANHKQDDDGKKYQDQHSFFRVV